MGFKFWVVPFLQDLSLFFILSLARLKGGEMPPRWQKKEVKEWAGSGVLKLEY